MTPREWNHVLDHKVEWSIAYPAVARAVRDYLFGPSQSCVAYPGITTTELVEALYPMAATRGDGVFARARIYKALDALREHELADWCHQEEPTRARFGKMIRRVRWHQPQAVTEAEEVQTPELPPAWIDVVFDGPPGHEAGRFVEVEDMEGKSISAGEWLQRPDGLWALRLPIQA